MSVHVAGVAERSQGGAQQVEKYKKKGHGEILGHRAGQSFSV